MQATAHMVIRVLLVAAGAFLALTGLRSNDPFQEIAGAVLLVILVALVALDLFRGRKRLVR